MTFLQPWLLIALPVMALPIIIHLINQRRYQTMPWGAMMFLLAANRMSRGYARIRQWLILLFRTLAIAALIFVISRPLASGWIGAAAGGGADTAIVLLDRSPTMQQRGDGTSVSKLETGVAQLAAALETVGSARTVLIDSATTEPRELSPTETLVEAPDVTAVDAAADLPTMLLAALDYMRANKLGQTDIWICSDLRENDWNATDGRWKTLRDAFAQFDDRLRFHLLAYPQMAEDNASVRVTKVRREQTSEGAEVLVSLEILRDGSGGASADIPIEFEVDGARSVLSVEASGSVVELSEHRIPVAEDHVRGWGRVSISADANAADNDDYFVFDVPPPRKALVVSNDPDSTRPLELAAGIAPTSRMEVEAIHALPDNLAAVAWEELSLVLWQGSLPSGEDAELIEAFVDRGGRVIFFPPREPSGNSLFGVSWGQWHEPEQEVGVESWRGDADLLVNTLSGAALPVGTLKVRGYAEIVGEAMALATLADGQPLLVRAATPRGGVYFCSTTPRPGDSTLASEGVVLYVAVQRASNQGLASLGNVRQWTAGTVPQGEAVSWKRIAGREDGLSTEQAYHAGIYEVGDRLVAVQRPPAEDRAERVDDPTIRALFGGLSLDRVDDTAGNVSSLVQEIWRIFLIAMMIALVIEAALCIPKITTVGGIAA